MMNLKKHKVVYKIKGGTWENKTNKPLVEFVEGDGVSKNIPVYMRHKMFHKSKGSWDKDPYTTRITEDTVFTYKYKLDPFFPLLAYSFVAILLAFSLFLSNSFKKKNNKPVIKDNMIAVAENIDYDDLVDPIVDDDPSRNPNFNTDSISFGDDITTTNTDTPSLVNREDLTYYTVSFLNIDGRVLQSGRYQVGSVPSYTGSTPTYSDNEYRYTFTGWGSISAVTGNATYTAQYSRERKQQDDPTPQVTRYTISTSVNDESMGSVSGAGTYDANATVTLTPTATDGYHFVKWSDENTDNPRTVTVTADATYEAIFESDIVMPVKGNVIKLKDIYGNDPTAEYRFRVLSTNGNEAKLLALFNASDSLKFDSESPLSNVYDGSNLDTYLNTTWYGTLSDTIKGAIQSTAIVQNVFRFNSGIPSEGTENVVAKGTYGTSTNYYYYITGGYESVPVGERNVFALDVQDVIDYLDGEDLSKDKLLTMFNIGNFDHVWLRSANADNSLYVWSFNGSNLTSFYVTYGYAVRPAFNIDLSKEGVEFSIEGSDPVVQQYTISTSVNDESMGSVSGAGTYDVNATVTLTPTAISGYHFVKWSDENTDNPRTVTVTADATYEAIFAQDVAMPVKGNVIKLKNVYADDPDTEYRFRVLSIDGNNAKLLVQFDASGYQVFNSSDSNVYDGSSLDTYLNDTWYGTLSDTMKGAIQSTTIVQNTFKWNDGVPADGTQNVVAKSTYSTSYKYYITGGYDSTPVEERNVFALDVQDVIDYLDGEDLSKDKINTMFNIENTVYVWLRSATADSSCNAWYVDSDYGDLCSGCFVGYGNAVRQAFNIDLSKEGVEFSIE